MLSRILDDAGTSLRLFAAYERRTRTAQSLAAADGWQHGQVITI